eukprot:SAG31_NODE_722_length_12572_cov_2.409124_14_plen_78_part_00
MTELMEGSLDSMLWGKTAGTFRIIKPVTRALIAIGIASGMSYLHQNDVAHRDLKSGNVVSVHVIIVTSSTQPSRPLY